MGTKQAVGAASCAVAGVALGVTLEAHVFEDWPWWATLGVAILCGYIGFWGLRPKAPDRGKTYWEKRLPEMESLAKHLRSVHFQETFLDPLQVTNLRDFAETLDGLGIRRPTDGRLEGDLLYVWSRYLDLFVDRVKRKKASNLRPLAEELRVTLNAEKDAQIALETRIFGPRLEGGETTK